MEYRVLVLTDHKGHSAENSLYALLQHLARHASVQLVDWASRSYSINDSFFSGNQMQEIHVSTVDQEFSFESAQHINEDELRIVDTANYDFIFLRLPRPVSDDYLIALSDYFQGKCIVNHPHGIVETSNKSFLPQFAHLTVPMRVCRSVQEVREFAENREIVLKPLREYGGKGLMRMNGEKAWMGDEFISTDQLLQDIESTLLEDGYLAMEFLPNVTQGDKRLLVVDGEIMAASLRLPKEGSWLCNVAQGGQSVPAEPEPEEIEMIQQIRPILHEKGIFIYGVDTLVDNQGKRVLSEINTLSIGGFPQAEKQTGLPILSRTIDKIIDHIDSFYDKRA